MAAEPGTTGPSSAGTHAGTVGVWIATAAIIAAVIIGGIALIYWNWPLFWIGGVALFVLGCVGAYFTNIMDAVMEYGNAESEQSGQPG
ncbi:MAG TPA: hypothetical protein VG708_02695 [Mycobacteriales bacterium]|jgi:hypothetical protein|nr:hypothetical protein [Mycobacteriales bacterium]